MTGMDLSLENIGKCALDNTKPDGERITFIDLLRLSKNPIVISTLIDVVINQDNVKELRDYSEYCILDFGVKALEQINDRLIIAQKYMSETNIGKRKFDKKKMNKANDTYNITQRLMNAINIDKIKDGSDLLKLKSKYRRKIITKETLIR